MSNHITTWVYPMLKCLGGATLAVSVGAAVFVAVFALSFSYGGYRLGQSSAAQPDCEPKNQEFTLYAEVIQ